MFTGFGVSLNYIKLEPTFKLLETKKVTAGKSDQTWSTIKHQQFTSKGSTILASLVVDR